MMKTVPAAAGYLCGRNGVQALIQPVTLLLIIAVGYMFKRFGLFGPRDYRVLQTAEFNLVLPGAIIYSFAGL